MPKPLFARHAKYEYSRSKIEGGVHETICPTIVSGMERRTNERSNKRKSSTYMLMGKRNTPTYFVCSGINGILHKMYIFCLSVHSSAKHCVFFHICHIPFSFMNK